MGVQRYSQDARLLGMPSARSGGDYPRRQLVHLSVQPPAVGEKLGASCFVWPRLKHWPKGVLMRVETGFVLHRRSRCGIMRHKVVC